MEVRSERGVTVMTREDAQRLLLMRLIAAGFVLVLLLGLAAVILVAVYSSHG
jgi:hypothetical protein